MLNWRVDTMSHYIYSTRKVKNNQPDWRINVAQASHL